MHVVDDCWNRVVIEFQSQRSAVTVGDHRDTGRPVQGDADHAAGDVDRHDAARRRQEALDLRGAAVDFDLADVYAARIDHRVPRRAVNLETPRVAWIELDLAEPDTTQSPHNDGLTANDSRRRSGALVGGHPDQRVHV